MNMTHDIDVAITEARSMARRHANNEYNRARDSQTIDTIDCLVGRFGWDAGRGKYVMVWPAVVNAAAGETLTVSR